MFSINCVHIVFIVCQFIRLARPSLRNSSTSKDTTSSSVVIRVFRGLHSLPDRVDVCSENVASVQEFVAQTGASMGCATNNTGSCGATTTMVGYHCRCMTTSPTYVESRRRCVSNGWLRDGCDFRFGSWQHKTGWTWSSMEGPLLSLYIDDGYGITGAFNASIKNYQSCSLVNLTMLNERGTWETFVYDQKTMQLFPLRRRYHIGWNTEGMSPKSKQKLRGRILRFSISCQPLDTMIQDDIVKEPYTSCLLFKVAGNFTSEHINEESSNEQSDGKTLAIGLGVAFSLLFIIGILFALWCYKRRTGNSGRQRFSVMNFLEKKI